MFLLATSDNWKIQITALRACVMKCSILDSGTYEAEHELPRIPQNVVVKIQRLVSIIPFL